MYNYVTISLPTVIMFPSINGTTAGENCENPSCQGNPGGAL